MLVLIHLQQHFLKSLNDVYIYNLFPIMRFSSFMVWRFFLIVIPCFMNPFLFNWWTVWNGKFSSPPMIPHPRPALVEYQSSTNANGDLTAAQRAATQRCQFGGPKNGSCEGRVGTQHLEKTQKNKEKPRNISRKNGKKHQKIVKEKEKTGENNSHDFLLWIGCFKQQSNPKKNRCEETIPGHPNASWGSVLGP